MSLANTDSSSAVDRRSNDRVSVDLLVNRFLNGYPYMCRATDISRSGMRIVPMLEPTEAPKFMGLQFQLPGIPEVITASGEAVFTADERTAVGIRFTRVPSESAALIDRFLSTAEP
jgi:PilZ domain-containing protein